MTDYQRPAAYIRIARDGTGAIAGQRRAIFEAARARGWSEPALYVDVDGTEAGPGLARLAAAISTGQHDALMLGGVGMICRSPADLMRLLRGCARHGVAVECATVAGAARGAGIGFPREGRGRRT